MATIGESRSKETGNHVKRVADYSRILALKWGMPLDEAEILKMASPMHDIGKVGIPDAILKKPGKLTPEEYEVMKSHSPLGYDMLKNSKRNILQAAAIVAGEHHEKYDGTGYPNGTKGEDIHIYGRITAIADVFDALASDRVYKKAWPLEDVLNLFKEQKGKHFDPRLIELFLENLDEFLEVRDKYQDVFAEDEKMKAAIH
jgi:response regulator RpfG family c-di-GMP phosphodiesterase